MSSWVYKEIFIFMFIMSLITSIYDVRSVINMPYLRKEFYGLNRDPYVATGFRHKHIIRYKREKIGFKKLPIAPLYQSSKVNPTHGDVHREYPEIQPLYPQVMYQVLRTFSKYAKVPMGETVLMQYQRIVCDPEMPGLPAVEGWHRDDVSKVAVICVDRHNVDGGVTHIKNDLAAMKREDPHDDPATLSFELLPGYMVLFDDTRVKHYVTPIKSADEKSMGWRDVVLLSYGGSSAAAAIMH